jgi:hypothetical protein
LSLKKLQIFNDKSKMVGLLPQFKRTAYCLLPTAYYYFTSNTGTSLNSILLPTRLRT